MITILLTVFLPATHLIPAFCSIACRSPIQAMFESDGASGRNERVDKRLVGFQVQEPRMLENSYSDKQVGYRNSGFNGGVVRNVRYLGG